MPGCIKTVSKMHYERRANKTLANETKNEAENEHGNTRAAILANASQIRARETVPYVHKYVPWTRIHSALDEERGKIGWPISRDPKEGRKKKKMWEMYEQLDARTLSATHPI